MASNRVILHVDMDAFYASVEQRERPELRGKPVIVGGAGPRGVVAAASYEVRRFGVFSAMPVARALRRCPDAIIVRPRGALYAEVSRQVFEIFGRFTPLVESLSLDEAFLDVSGTERLFGDGVEVARRIRKTIAEELRLTASVGVAPNKFLAKVASDLDKPDGLTVVPVDVVGFLDPLSVRRIWGIGPKAAERLATAGISKVKDLRLAHDDQLKALLGRGAAHLKALAQGEDFRPVTPFRADRSVSHEETFATDLRALADCNRELLRLAGAVARRLRVSGQAGRVVRVKIRQGDFTTMSRQVRLDHPVSDDQTIASTARRLFARWWREYPDSGIRLLGVGVADLTSSQQEDLFETAGTGALDALKDEVQSRFADAGLKPATLVKPASDEADEDAQN